MLIYHIPGKGYFQVIRKERLQRNSGGSQMADT
jgi:hypothetical protein